MNHLSSTLVLCDLDHLLLGADGNLTQAVSYTHLTLPTICSV